MGRIEEEENWEEKFGGPTNEAVSADCTWKRAGMRRSSQPGD